jgi:hypothetical protein
VSITYEVPGGRLFLRGKPAFLRDQWRGAASRRWSRAVNLLEAQNSAWPLDRDIMPDRSVRDFARETSKSLELPKIVWLGFLCATRRIETDSERQWVTSARWSGQTFPTSEAILRPQARKVR